MISHSVPPYPPEAEERFQAIAELISDYALAYRLRPDGSLSLEWVSDGFTRVSGYTAEELNASGWAPILHPDDLWIARRLVEGARAGEGGTFETRLITKPGEVRWLRTVCRPRRDGAGAVVGFYAAAQDITEQKGRDEEIRYLTSHAPCLLWQGTVTEREDSG